MRRKAMTLIELIIALILISGILTAVSASLVFFVNQIQANLERSTMHSQMNYALEDMKIRCVSAVGLVGGYFNLAGSIKTLPNEYFSFSGEKNPREVTLNNAADNYTCSYYRGPKGLMVSTWDMATNTTREELLIESKFNPIIIFRYVPGAPPNLLQVELKATSISNKVPLGGTAEITKTGDIKFWFIDVVQ